MPRVFAIVVLFAGAVGALASPHKKSADDFDGFAGFALRSAIAGRKDFAKQWSVVEAEESKTAVHYLMTAIPLPAFHGVAIDHALLVVSKRLHIVVGFAFRLTGPRCASMGHALDEAWGASEPIGGRNHVIEWRGQKVDASLEDDGPLACMLFIGDRGWSDETDELKPSAN